MLIRTKTLEPKILDKMASLDVLVKEGKLEKKVHTLYHIKDIAGASDGSKSITAPLNFFAVKRGQPDDTGNPTSIVDTNMESPSSVGQNYYFWGQTLRIGVFPSKNDQKPFVKEIDKANLQKFFINDAGKLLVDGAVEIRIVDSTLVSIAPLINCPTGVSIKLPSITSDGTFSNADFDASNPEVLRPIDMWLENNITFNLEIRYDRAKVIYNDLRMGVFIDGILYKPRG